MGKFFERIQSDEEIFEIFQIFYPAKTIQPETLKNDMNAIQMRERMSVF